jgi:hypothetical protein
VVEMDQPLAGTDGWAEEVLDFTALSREVAEAPLVVHGTFHAVLVPLRPDVMRLIVAPTAQPHEVFGHVSPTLGAVDAVMDVVPRAHGAHPAQLHRVLEPEAPQCLRVTHSSGGLEV